MDNFVEIYLDNASTTKPVLAVTEAVSFALTSLWGNPSNIYKVGNTSKVMIEHAKDTIASAIGCDAEEVFFTSGASEGNAFVRFQALANNIPLYCSYYEHHNYIQDAYMMDDIAFIEDDINTVLNKAKSSNGFVYSHMLVDNITGRVFPEVSVIFNAMSQMRKESGKKIITACDCTQAFGNVRTLNVKELGCDIAVFSGHKFHAPKGIGFMYISKEFQNSGYLYPMIHGTQQSGLRGGTENVPYIRGLDVAVKLFGNDEAITVKSQNGEKLWSVFKEELDKENIKYLMNRPDNKLHINSTYSFSVGNNVNSEVIQSILSEQYSIYIGTGSGCNGHDEKDSIILEIAKKEDRPSEYENGTIRISFDGFNLSEEEVRFAAQKFCEVYKTLI